MWKYIASVALIGIVSGIELQHATYGGYAGPTLIKTAPLALKTIAYEHEAPAVYDFEYSVHDPHTGDIKAQKESRKGDVVIGSYELIEPGGIRRLVQYQADKHNGFNAIVHREPTDIKIPEPEHKIISGPIHKVVAAAPLAHYAPIQHTLTKVIAAPASKLYTTHQGQGESHVSLETPKFSYHY